MLLDDNAVFAEMTCTEHVAVHRYEYRDSLRNLFLDLQSGQTSSRDSYETRVLNAEVAFEDAYTISGWNELRGWVNRKLYYVIRFDSPVISRETVPGDTRNKAGKYVLRFDPSERELGVKVAFSYVSVGGAKAALEASTASARLPRSHGRIIFRLSRLRAAMSRKPPSTLPSTIFLSSLTMSPTLTGATVGPMGRYMSPLPGNITQPFLSGTLSVPRIRSIH